MGKFEAMSELERRGALPADLKPQLEKMRTVTGGDFLKQLDPDTAATVKSVAEGRKADFSGMILKTPYGQMIMNAVNRYDPQFDASLYPARVAARKFATSGKGADNLRALATAAGHAKQLDARVDAPNAPAGTSIPAINAIANFARENIIQDDGPGNYKTNAAVLAGEVNKAVGGPVAQKAHDEMVSKLSVNDSSDVKHSRIQEFRQLMGSRAKPLLDQIASGMRTDHNGLKTVLPEYADLIDAAHEAETAHAGKAVKAGPGGKLVAGKDGVRVWSPN